MDKTANQLVALITNWKHKWIAFYLIAGLLTIAAYPFARSIMIKQETSFIAVLSNVPGTLNFILLFFLWGLMSDKMTKKMSRRNGWIVFFIGIFVLITFFQQVGGFEIAVFK